MMSPNDHRARIRLERELRDLRAEEALYDEACSKSDGAPPAGLQEILFSKACLEYELWLIQGY